MVPKILVVIPTYNERLALPVTLSALFEHRPEVEVLVVDDGSPDGTGDWVDEQAARDPRIHVLHRSEKAGLGMAYIAGFAWALERDYDIICEFDADGSHRPVDLGRLLEVARGDDADLVIGSRWTRGGAIVNWPRSRFLLSRGANIYVDTVMGLGVRDATAGFRAYRREVLESLDLSGVESQGYCFQIDMTYRTVEAGFRVAEVPIVFVERELGESKMSSSIISEAFTRVAAWGLSRRGRQVRRALSVVAARRSGHQTTREHGAEAK
ncbi:dolichol-phosphate mannosyltransferase [Brevibacterium sanguinis]|uniref:Dolichol-phosphate mannosyltransferase n=2 Tax=Brevibacterium TaxID=1696 RepID=A0A366IIJ7_9MICO|nr:MULTISPECIES: polyprenol monophosphomannose synthase [Brevibacterium]RBP64711.1 dolichol-phosphate mannosyltransferase [Brevibacterium sanguinis]RBP71646.1 dolichol-phosphate mannosyltransferase [Brevibacterium celere]